MKHVYIALFPVWLCDCYLWVNLNWCRSTLQTTVLLFGLKKDTLPWLLQKRGWRRKPPSQQVWTFRLMRFVNRESVTRSQQTVKLWKLHTTRLAFSGNKDKTVPPYRGAFTQHPTSTLPSTGGSIWNTYTNVSKSGTFLWITFGGMTRYLNGLESCEKELLERQNKEKALPLCIHKFTKEHFIGESRSTNTQVEAFGEASDKLINSIGLGIPTRLRSHVTYMRHICYKSGGGRANKR